MVDIQNSSRMSPTSYLGKYWLSSCEISWVHYWYIASNSTWMLAIEIQISARPSDWVWRNSINSQFGQNTNPYQQSNTTPYYIIPLEGNPSNKTKEPHRQVKCLRQCSIFHWNYIHPRLYIHTFFQVISMTVIKTLHTIGWFTRRNHNWVIVTLAGAFPWNKSPTNIPLKRYPGQHWHHKIVKT